MTSLQDTMVDSLPADEIFPHFIAEELPTGMAGIVISGALAAAMSSLDSSLNAISSVVVVDFAQPLCPARSDTQQLQLGRFVTAATTVLMVAVALLFRAADKTAMFGEQHAIFINSQYLR
jgi:SSS family solute:Na+ symporter